MTGVSPAPLWRFLTSPPFTPAKHAALDLALAAGGCPSSVTDEHFIELKKHFSEDAIIEIAPVTSFPGWKNR